MVTFILLCLMGLSLVAWFSKWRNASPWLLGVSVFLLMFSGSGALPQLLLSTLETHPRLSSIAWKESNAIVLLGSGFYRWRDGSGFVTHPLGLARLYEAARLYQDCKEKEVSCKVLTTGGDLYELGKEEGVLLAEELEDIGVPSEDILIEKKSKNTYENALHASEFIRSENFRQVVIVTSGFHLRRALVLFKHFGLAPLPAPSENINLRPSLLPRASNLYWSDLALHEFGGLGKFHLVTFLGIAY